MKLIKNIYIYRINYLAEKIIYTKICIRYSHKATHETIHTVNPKTIASNQEI